mmetsp:Transcript_3878/g.11590  ORF Transcript_3878/g.11590 Transcript_3878/m.11590 type:complete len:105 (+) Transcript_3878:4233-4547(+)
MLKATSLKTNVNLTRVNGQCDLKVINLKATNLEMVNETTSALFLRRGRQISAFSNCARRHLRRRLRSSWKQMLDLGWEGLHIGPLVLCGNLSGISQFRRKYLGS